MVQVRKLTMSAAADPISDRAESDGRDLVRALEIHKRDLALVATELIGPVPPFFHRIGGRYRWQIIIRSPNPNRLLKDFTILRDWILELDPVSTL